MVLLFFASNSHLRLLALFYQSVQRIPFGKVTFNPMLVHVITDGFCQGILTGMQFAFPMIAIELVSELAMGILMRIIPQINVFTVNFQVKIIMGLLMMLLLFSMKGKIDSVQMVTLYMDEESIMPIVLESGKITVTISNTDLKAVGTSLNNALYEFISKRNQLEESIGELEQKETRMVLDGGDLDEIHGQLVVEGDSLMKAMNQYVKTFISDNYENVLGPSVFMMLCSSLPYPIMTPQIDDIIKDAPYSFKDNKLVREFLSKARENMKLIEEHQRLEQNASTNK